jgi:hypothetical protein
MLDNSAVMSLPQLADGNVHNVNNLPIVIAGSSGGYLKQGASVNLEGAALGTGNSEASCTAPGDESQLNTGPTTGRKEWLAWPPPGVTPAIAYEFQIVDCGE